MLCFDYHLYSWNATSHYFLAFSTFCSLDHPIIIDVIREIRNGQEREVTLRLNQCPRMNDSLSRLRLFVILGLLVMIFHGFEDIRNVRVLMTASKRYFYWILGCVT